MIKKIILVSFVSLFVLTFGVQKIQNLISFGQARKKILGQKSKTIKEPEFIKGQIIVKFKDSVTECVECIIKINKSFKNSTSDNSDSLDVLNKKYKVKSAVPLFRTKSDKTVKTSQLKDEERMKIEKVKQKFSQRSQRGNALEVLPNLYHIYLLNMPEGDIKSAVAQYRLDPHVEYTHPNYIIKTYASPPTFYPNDPYYNSASSWGQGYDDLWGLKKVQPDSGWFKDDTANGNNVIVAVVDSGLDYNHEDILVSVWVNAGEIATDGIDNDNNGFIDDFHGWNFADDDNNPMDVDGHGTHISGVIAAQGNNAKGIIGVAPKAKIMPVKGIGLGSGNYATLAQGILYAAYNGADVVNGSWGCWRCTLDVTSVVEDTVNFAHTLGLVMVFAAGNRADNVLYSSPQRLVETIKVAASNHNDNIIDFSNHGVFLDFAAPGAGVPIPPPSDDPIANILSLKSTLCPNCGSNLTVGKKYLRLSGTSLSAAYVSGAVAAILSRRPKFTNEDIRQVLRITSDDIESSGFDEKSGWGRINLAKALSTDSIIRVKITSPSSLTAFRPDNTRAYFIDINGTALGVGKNHQFASYQLFFAEQNIDISGVPPNWIAINNPVASQIDNGYLGSWNIARLDKKVYMLKLEAQSSDGKKYHFIVPNIYITSPASYQNYSLPIDSAARPYPQDLPKASGNRVVYRDLRNNIRHIYLYDFTTNTEKLIANQYPRDAFYTYLDISADKVIWEEKANYPYSTLYLYDLTLNGEFEIARSSQHDSASHINLEPAIWGNNIAWRDKGLDNIYRLYMCTFNPANGTCQPRQIASSSYIRSVDINKDLIVWKDRRSGAEGIYVYNLITNAQYRIVADPDNKLERPRVSGYRVVWYDTSSPYPTIYFCENATVVPCPIQGLLSTLSYKMHPDISGDRWVWEDIQIPPPGEPYPLEEIYLYKITYPAGAEERVTDNPYGQYEPTLSAGRVFWTDYRNQGIDGQNSDIYYADILNRSPIPTYITDITAYIGEALSSSLQGNDPDEDLLNYSASQLPEGATLNSYTGELTWTPRQDQIGSYTFTYSVSDGRSSSKKTLTINVIQRAASTPTPTRRKPK